MSKILFVLAASCLFLGFAAPAHAQHRGCHAGSYASYGSTFSTFASPFFVSQPFVPTVALPVPTVASAPLLSTSTLAVPSVASFPVASGPGVVIPSFVSTPMFSTFVGTPFYSFGTTNRVYRHHR